MNDIKNLTLAWLSAGSPVIAFAGSDAGLTIVSAIILPIILFAIGKAVDVLLQIYFAKGRNEKPEADK